MSVLPSVRGAGRGDVHADDRAEDVGIVDVDRRAGAGAGERRRRLVSRSLISSPALSSWRSAPVVRRRDEVGLVREDLVLARVGLAAERDEVRLRVVRRRVRDAGDHRLARRRVVAGLVAQRQFGLTSCSRRSGHAVLLDLVVVVVGAAVVVGLIDRLRRQHRGRPSAGRSARPRRAGRSRPGCPAA